MRAHRSISVVLSVLLIGCSATASLTIRLRVTAVERAIAQRGSTRLQITDQLVVGSDETRDRPGNIVISDPSGTHVVNHDGWLLGTLRDRAIVAEIAGPDIRILAIPLSGEPVELARTPRIGEHPRIIGAVASDGTVALVSDRVHLFAPHGGEVPSAVKNAFAIAGDPHGTAFGIYGSNGLSLMVGGTLRWTRPIGNVEDLAFVAGKLLVRVGDGVYGFDLDSGERAMLIPAPDVRPRNVTFAPSGEAFAWTHDIRPGDIMPISNTRACQIFVVKARDPQSGREPVLEVPTGCYEGIGMAFVGDTLWVAPPRQE